MELRAYREGFQRIEVAAVECLFLFKEFPSKNLPVVPERTFRPQRIFVVTKEFPSPKNSLSPKKSFPVVLLFVVREVEAEVEAETEPEVASEKDREKVRVSSGERPRGGSRSRV